MVLETTGLEEGLMDPYGGFGTRKPDQDQDPLGGLLDLPKPSTETSPGIPLRCGNQCTAVDLNSRQCLLANLFFFLEGVPNVTVVVNDSNLHQSHCTKIECGVEGNISQS